MSTLAFQEEPAAVAAAQSRTLLKCALHSHLWLTAEVTFVAGWSLFWACALGLLGFIPLLLCLCMLLAGLGLLSAYLHREAKMERGIERTLKDAFANAAQTAFADSNSGKTRPHLRARPALGSRKLG